jgi:Zn-dependent protease
LDRKKEAKLSDNAEAEIALAGLFGNVVFGMLVVAAYFAGKLSADSASRIINLNASLVLFNLIPIAIFDGSKFVTVLFHNLSPKFCRFIFDFTSVPVLLAMLLIVYLRGSVTPAIPLILFGLFRRKNHAGDDKSERKPMLMWQRVAWAAVYTYMVLAALVAFTLTPNWANP